MFNLTIYSGLKKVDIVSRSHYYPEHTAILRLPKYWQNFIITIFKFSIKSPFVTHYTPFYNPRFLAAASSSSQAGEYIIPSFAPYQLSLQSDGEHICGGALIDELHALTAARCFVQRGETGDVQVYDPEIDGELTVVAGIASLEDKVDEALRRKVAMIVVPEGYSPDEFHVNDVAVVKVGVREIAIWVLR